MEEALVEGLIQYLWRNGSGPEDPTVYAVLDGARDPRILNLLKESGVTFKCLYAGELSDEMLAVAPHIVRLTPKNLFTQTLLTESSGNSWGIFVVVARPALMGDVRNYMRTYLKVQNEKGKQLLFRFYDPRVLRVYLPSCDPIQAKALFGPIIEFVAEADELGQFWSFTRSKQGVESNIVSVPVGLSG